MFYAIDDTNIQGHFHGEKQFGQKQVWTYSVLDDQIYGIRCPFVALGPNARFIVLPHWDNMSKVHMLTHPVTLY